MKDIKTWLREGDPLAHEEPIARDAFDAIRQKVVAEARAAQTPRGLWRHSLAMAAMLALLVAAGVLASRWNPGSAPAVEVDASTPAQPGDGRRQMQFSTPGGTRIIWVFDPEFQVKETLP